MRKINKTLSCCHMRVMAYGITSNSTVCSTACTGWHQRKHQHFHMIGPLWGESPHKGPCRKCYHFMTSSLRVFILCLKMNIYVWLGARLQYPHCYCTGDTAALHQAISIYLSLKPLSKCCLLQVTFNPHRKSQYLNTNHVFRAFNSLRLQSECWKLNIKGTIRIN